MDSVSFGLISRSLKLYFFPYSFIHLSVINNLYKQEIRNHRRLAKISDFSFLAPPAGLVQRKRLNIVFSNGVA